MSRNPYASPIASLRRENGARLFMPMLLAIAGGAASWLIFLQAMRAANIFIWMPLFAAGRLSSFNLAIAATAIPVYLPCGASLTLLKPKRRVIYWMAFVLGIAICIVVRHGFRPDVITYALVMFRRPGFLTAVIASGAALLLASLYLRTRSKDSRERTTAESA